MGSQAAHDKREEDRAVKSDTYRTLLACNTIFQDEEKGQMFTAQTFGIFRVKLAWSKDGTADEKRQAKVTMQINPLADLQAMAKAMSSGGSEPADLHMVSATQLRMAIMDMLEAVKGEAGGNQLSQSNIPPDKPTLL